MPSPSATQERSPYQNEPIWSRSEKTIAHRVFDAALKRGLQCVMRKTKQKANQISEPAEVSELERYLTQRRKDVNCKYDFRSSRLTRVFGTLLCECRITDQEVRGLGEDKVKAIRSCAKVLSEDAAQREF